MSGVCYYLPAFILLVVFALRAPGLLRHRHDPLIRSVAVVLPMGSVVFFLAAPPTVSEVNGLTSIANFSVPLVYAVVTAASAAVINLMLSWRGGPEEQRRTATRWCIGLYGGVIAVMLALFALGDAPDERLRDFDTHYATAPYLSEMIVLCVLAHALATVSLAILCWRWAREVAGLLRAGLLLMVGGGVLSMGYVACKLVAVGARWAGHDLDAVSTTTAPLLAVLATLLQCFGLALPSVSQGLVVRWHRWSRYRRLGPLWRVMREVIPYELVRIPWWSSLSRRHLRRTCDIRDGLRLLYPYLEREAGADEQEFTTGPGALEPESAACAAVIVAAFHSLRTRPGHSGGSVERLLEGDEGLLRLSDAIRPMALPAGVTPQATAPSPVLGSGRRSPHSGGSPPARSGPAG